MQVITSWPLPEIEPDTELMGDLLGLSAGPSSTPSQVHNSASINTDQKVHLSLHHVCFDCCLRVPTCCLCLPSPVLCHPAKAVRHVLPACVLHSLPRLLKSCRSTALPARPSLQPHRAALTDVCDVQASEEDGRSDNPFPSETGGCIAA